jgi:hypothetical protein
VRGFLRRSIVGDVPATAIAIGVTDHPTAGAAIPESASALTHTAIELSNVPDSDLTMWPCVSGIAVTCSHGPCTYTVLAREAFSLCSPPLLDD